MVQTSFEALFDGGDLDCEFAAFISEKYDAWNKAKMLSLWDDPKVFLAFKDQWESENV